MKMNNFRGDLTDILAKKEALEQVRCITLHVAKQMYLQPMMRLYARLRILICIPHYQRVQDSEQASAAWVHCSTQRRRGGVISTRAMSLFKKTRGKN